MITSATSDLVHRDELSDKIYKAPSGEAISKITLSLLEMLLEKNISYGDSALKPINIFSQANPYNQLKVRIDDKLNRIMNKQKFAGDDDVRDLVGYLILLLVLEEQS